MQKLLQAQLDALRAGQAHVLVTIAQAQGSVPRTSGRILVYADGHSLGTIGGGSAEHRAKQDALRLLASGEGGLLSYAFPASDAPGAPCAGQLLLLFEVFHPKPLLVVFGGGHVGKSLLRLATPTGFSTLLLDDRPEEAIQEAAQLAERSLRLSDIEADMCACGIPEGAYFVLCGHDHEADYHALAAALQLRPRYVGMLASRRKIDALFSKLSARGFSPAQLASVHTPIGLDLGGESPEELAVGILAELLLVKNEKDGRGESHRNAPTP